MVVWIKMPLATAVGIGLGDIVLDGDPAPPKGQSPQFSAHVYCGQTAVCIRKAFGTEVGLGLGDIVLDGHAAPCPQRGTAPRPLKGHSPRFSAHVRCGQTAGWT